MVKKTVSKRLANGTVIEVPNSQYSILTKDQSYLKTFQKKVRRDFKCSVVLEKDIELDYPPILTEEWLTD